MTPAALRYELKLVCDGHHLAQARSWIRMHPAGLRTAYPPRWVNSLYLDSHTLCGLAENLDGVADREKLRLRWYGDGLTPEASQLELKGRRGLLGYKRVLTLDAAVDLTRPWWQILPEIKAAAGTAWQIKLQTLDRPSLLTRYMREYYVTPDEKVRVTLDYDQVAYNQRLTPRLSLASRLPMADAVVIEVKADEAYAEEAAHVVRHFPLLRTRNSKYVNGVLAAL